MARDVNYDEALVPAYTLPDALVDAAGQPVQSAAQWRQQRRGEVLRLFEDHVYGHMPAPWPDTRSEVFDEDPQALQGQAIRRQTRVRFSHAEADNGPTMDLLLYLPAQAGGPVPVFLGLNFFGNHSVHADPDIRLSAAWMRRADNHGVVDHKATEAARASQARRWPIERILARGYGVATIYCGDLDPDYDDGYANGVHPLFYRDGQTQPADHEWGAIGAWAWGLSRGLDVLEADTDVDSARIAVMGHSRLGKTALWAGACDERFALVISNDSGCGGAALSRRRFGETVAVINEAFPHWFCHNHRAFDHREHELPVDQHELIALMAPRPVYVASAIDDGWADPTGEFLAAVHAGPVYRLLGCKDLGTTQMPMVDTPVQLGMIGYHVRTGGHDVTPWDWERWMDFADARMSAGGS